MDELMKTFCCAQTSKNAQTMIDAKTTFPAYGEKIGDCEYSVHVIGFDGFYFSRAYYNFTSKTWYMFNYDYTDNSFGEFPWHDMTHWMPLPELPGT